jgi:hypothetical protein
VVGHGDGVQDANMAKNTNTVDGSDGLIERIANAYAQNLVT